MTPDFNKSHKAWDPMLVRFGDYWYCYMLCASNKEIARIGAFFMAKNHIWGFRSKDFRTWENLGPIMSARRDRLCAGSVIAVEDKLLMFGSRTVTQLDSQHLDQRLFLAKSSDGANFTESKSWELLPDPKHCWSKRKNPKTGAKMWAWRDPFPFRDPVSGKWYLYISSGAGRWGVRAQISVAEADSVDGQYEVLPGAANDPRYEWLPGKPGFRELERAGVFYHDGKYHMIVSAWFGFTDRAVQRHLRARYKGYSQATLHLLVSDSPRGPFKFQKRAPVIDGSHNTGYGHTFVHHEGKLVSLGWRIKKIAVDPLQTTVIDIPAAKLVVDKDVLCA